MTDTDTQPHVWLSMAVLREMSSYSLGKLVQSVLKNILMMVKY